jgi:hypothetical protein
MSDSGVDKCMSRLDVAYPNHFKREGLDADFALQVYHEILDDIDDALLMAATKQWLSTSRPFHPSPGELRDLALTLTERGDKTADEAWLEVLSALKSVGSYGVPAWSSERIAHAVAALGSWKDFCMTELDQMSYARISFVKIYEAQSRREHDDRLMLPETRSVVLERIGQIAERKRLNAG